jgi:hypothetical protein
MIGFGNFKEEALDDAILQTNRIIERNLLRIKD